MSYSASCSSGSSIAGSDEQLVSRGKQIIHLAVVMSQATSVDSYLLFFMNLVDIESLFKIADLSSVICLYFTMFVLMEKGKKILKNVITSNKTIAESYRKLSLFSLISVAGWNQIKWPVIKIGLMGEMKKQHIWNLTQEVKLYSGLT